LIQVQSIAKERGEKCPTKVRRDSFAGDWFLFRNILK
jgi:hypothetical protein